jgi:hypothetical protein
MRVEEVEAANVDNSAVLPWIAATNIGRASVCAAPRRIDRISSPSHFNARATIDCVLVGKRNVLRERAMSRARKWSAILVGSRRCTV